MTIRQGLTQIEQLLAAAQAAPIRMAQDDWRNQMESVAQDLLATSSDLRSLATRLSGQSPLNSDVLKVTDDVDFVANEFHMALDYDPDATHFIRATRAEQSTAKAIDGLLVQLR